VNIAADSAFVGGPVNPLGHRSQALLSQILDSLIEITTCFLEGIPAIQNSGAGFLS
jgi:hypothetical protein